MDDREKMKKVLVPTLAIAGLIALVGLVLMIGGGPAAPDKPRDGGPGQPAPAAGGPPATLGDGTAPGADDSGLRDLGEGLKVRDLKVGEGPEVRPGERVRVHYTGWLMNGESFDSSRTRGEPIEFGLDGVVQGWGRGIPGMKPGGVRKLVIPPHLGYGERGAGAKIPPNATLVFEVELLPK